MEDLAPGHPCHLTATLAARLAITRLRVEHGGPVVFVESAGRRAGGVPMCYPERAFVPGAVDVLLGDIDGCRFYVDRRTLLGWRPERVELDVAPGTAEGSSLPAGPGLCFVTRTSGPRPHPRLYSHSPAPP